MDVSMMTDQQLAQMQNNPNSPIPGWLVLAEIAKRREMRQPSAQMPQGTVADKMRQQTQQDMAVAQNEQNADKDKAAMLAQLVQSGQINPGMFAGGSVRGFAGGDEIYSMRKPPSIMDAITQAIPYLKSDRNLSDMSEEEKLRYMKDLIAAERAPTIQPTPAAQTTPTPTPATAPAKPNITATNVSDVAKANKNATSPRGRSPDAETLQNLHAPVQHNDLPEQTNTQTAVQQQSGVDQVESMMTKQQPVSIEQRAKEIQKMLGNDLDFAQLAERISQNDKDLAEEKRNGTLLSILKGVTAAAGSYNEPFAVGGQQYRKGITPALAEGVLTGIQSYETGEKEYRLGKKEVNTALMALQELRHRVNSAATNAALQDAQNEAVRQHYADVNKNAERELGLKERKLLEVEIPEMESNAGYKSALGSAALARGAGGAGSSLAREKFELQKDKALAALITNQLKTTIPGTPEAAELQAQLDTIQQRIAGAPTESPQTNQTQGKFVNINGKLVYQE